MNKFKRKGPSRLMESMQTRVEELQDRLVTNDTDLNHSFELDINRVEPDPDQARKVFTEEHIEELAQSLKEHGQLQPVLVRPDAKKRGCYIIVAGERRLRAAQRAGLTRLLAIEHTVEHDVASLVENLHREDLNPIEEANGISLLASRYKWTQRQLAKKLSRSASDINGMLAIAKLPADIKAAVLNSEQQPARNLLIELARLPDNVERNALLESALNGELPFSRLREVAARQREEKNPTTATYSRIRREAKVAPPTARTISRVALALMEMHPSELNEQRRKSLENLRDVVLRLLDESIEA
ncbi:ParB/RepB/Spo0J family partition protein (plasmid) [Kozakia baliensis]|uniref:ParB/RepB/Spo0J family partition protein n=1 Tax=Kozakia baliensis TaxID=153496 RepID=UPI00345BA2FF